MCMDFTFCLLVKLVYNETQKILAYHSLVFEMFVPAILIQIFGFEVCPEVGS